VLTISSNDPANPTLTVTLSGTGIAPIAGVSPGTLAFSSPLNVTTAPKTVTLSNTGTAPLVINSIAFGGANPGVFARSITCPIGGAGLAAGGSCTINVTFTPTFVGTGTMTATLNVNVAAPATSQTVSLTGTVLVPVATVSPGTLAFSSPLNVTTAAKVVTLSNTGTAPLTINGIALGGTNPTEFARTTTCGASLAAVRAVQSTLHSARPLSHYWHEERDSECECGGPCDFSVGISDRHSPRADCQGFAHFAVVQFTVKCHKRSQDGYTVQYRVCTAGNHSLSFGGANPGVFARSNTCPIGGAGLAAGGSCTINVMFTPTFVGTGTMTATLNVNVAAPATSQTVSLTGTVLAPILTLSPTSLAFGTVTRGSASTARTVTVRNTGLHH